ncbi:hypothetical protein E2C01_031983 [Portunus trituberculatus]|uniref:Uncharacterized protein n=1 Tax=Portunus trituberculatus TaxID=210409 RepID=A0A5B7EZC4_PORTR|nr:hypothetical protein [Portunus trituberculatus]
MSRRDYQCQGLYTTCCLQGQGGGDWRHYGYRSTKGKAPSLLQLKQLTWHCKNTQHTTGHSAHTEVEQDENLPL